jgi:hypothetical protein
MIRYPCRERYSCFDKFKDDPVSYGLAAGHADYRTSERQVLKVLRDVLRMAPKDLRCARNQGDHRCGEDLSFYPIQVSYFRELHHSNVCVAIWQ